CLPPTAAIVPPAIATSPVYAGLPVPSMTVPPRMTMSCMERSGVCRGAMMRPGTGAGPWGVELARDPDVLRPNDAVRRLLVTLDLRRVREDPVLMIEVDQRLVGLDLRERLFVGRLSLGRLPHRARPGQAPPPRPLRGFF